MSRSGGTIFRRGSEGVQGSLDHGSQRITKTAEVMSPWAEFIADCENTEMTSKS
jgi:hypothetical protein